MNKRQDYILQKLDQTGSVKVRSLSEELGCSEVTIRNDIQKLEDLGQLRRTHGGAVRVREQLTLSLEGGNVFKHADKKKRIARQAVTHIQDGDTLILDESSINYYLADCLRAETDKHVVVMTNSLVVAMLLSSCEHVTVFMIGGQIGGGSGKLPAVMGETAVETIRKFHADKAFISAHGINFDAGITSIGSPQMQIKQAFLEVAKEVTVLVDSSKFGGGYIMAVCPLERVTRIITDTDISEEDQAMAAAHHVCMEIV